MPVIKIKKRKEGSNEEAPRPRKLRIKTKVKEEDEVQPEVKKSLRKSTSSGRSKKSDKGGGMKLKLSLRKSAEPEKPPKAPRLRVKPIRVPGEGYDSEASDIEDDPLIEEAIILRVLPDIQAEFVKHSIDSGDYSGISIKWKGQRHAIVNINDVSYGAILMNLPTVIEVNKSVDRKNLLKTVDVSQMLLCIQVIESEEEVFLLRPPDAEDLVSKHFEEYQDEINECKMKFFKGYNDGPLTELETKYLDQIATKPYDYKHGLTPPLYNVRNRRFRRKMGLDEFEYAEKCVEKLLRQDDQAEEVAYELVDEDEIQRRSTPAAALSQLDTYVAEPGDRDEKEEDDLDLDEAFQSDTEDAKDRVSFKDEAGDHAKENDLFDEAGDDVEQDNGEEEDEEEEEEEENEPDDDDEAEENAEGVQKQAVDEDRQHNELLKDELNELETTLNHARQKLQKAANPLLKSRFIESIKKLEREVELKKKQLKFSDETLQKPEEDSQPQSSEQQQQQTQDTANARETDDDDEEEEEDDEDEDEEDVEDDDEAEDRAASDQAQELDQNDLDMMMLFGAEGDDAEE